MVVGLNGRFDKSEVDDIFGHYLSQSSPHLLDSSPSESSTPETSDSEGNCSLKRKRQTTDKSLKKKSKPRCEQDRKDRRRLQNRQAAATSREKKKRHYTLLEGQVESLTEQNTALQQRIDELLHENKKLQTKKESKAVTSNPIEITPTAITASESAELLTPQQPEAMIAMAVLQTGYFVQAVLLPLFLLTVFQKKQFSRWNASSPTKGFKALSQASFNAKTALPHAFLRASNSTETAAQPQKTSQPSFFPEKNAISPQWTYFETPG